jgi:hypothetical protein
MEIHIRRPSHSRSLRPSKESIQHFKHEFFSFIVGLFALLDPDPADQNQKTKENGPYVHKG